jgi:putative endonuclease
MSSSKQSLGRWGEARAADFLETQGYQIVERNWRCELGEIDLIAKQAAVLVFVEVKARSSRLLGYPEEAVTPAKQQHLIEAAQNYLQSHPEQDGDWRIDVIAVQRAPDGPQIHHIENAVG